MSENENNVGGHLLVGQDEQKGMVVLGFPPEMAECFDAEKGGHADFSPAQARHLAVLLLQKAREIDGEAGGLPVELNSNQRAAVSRARRCVKLLDKISEDVDKKIPDEWLEQAGEKQIAKRLLPIMQAAMRGMWGIYPPAVVQVDDDVAELGALSGETAQARKFTAADITGQRTPELDAAIPRGYQRGGPSNRYSGVGSFDQMLRVAFDDLMEKASGELNRQALSGRLRDFSAIAVGTVANGVRIKLNLDVEAPHPARNAHNN